MEELVIPCRVDVVLPVPQKEVLQFANAAGLGERHTLSITPCMVHYTQDQYSHPDHLGIGLTSFFFFSEPPSACLHTQSIYLFHVLCVQCEYAHTHTHTHHLLGIHSKRCRFPGGFEEERGGISEGTTLTLLGLDT